MLLIVGCVVVLALIAVVVLMGRTERTPPELEADWWPRFEREFRAYAQRTARYTNNQSPRVRHPKPQPE